MNEYWRGRLGRNEQACYEKILQGARRRIGEVDCGSMSADSLREIHLAVFFDHPELFYLSSAFRISTRQMGFAGFGALSVSNRVLFDMIYSPTEIRDCEKKIAQALAHIRDGISPGMGDAEKVILAAEYVVRCTTYEINDTMNQNAAAALCYGRAQCSGISKAFHLIMDDLGIPCITVSGDAKDQNGMMGPHAWSIVEIGGAYYHVDVTFMLGANGDKPARLNRMYLFYDDARISKDHTWDRATVPACTDGGKYIDDFERGGSAWGGFGSLFGGASEGAGGLFGSVFGQRAAQKKERQTPPEREKRTPPVRGAQTPPVRGAQTPPRRANTPVYRSLSELRSALKAALQRKETALSFYMEIGEMSAEDMMKRVKNALQMTSETVNFSVGASITGSSDGFFQIDIQY